MKKKPIPVKWVLALIAVPMLVFFVAQVGMYVALESPSGARWKEQLLCQSDEKLVAYKIVYKGGNRSGVENFECCQKRSDPGRCASWDSQSQFQPAILIVLGVQIGLPTISAGIVLLLLLVRYRRAVRGPGARLGPGA